MANRFKTTNWNSNQIRLNRNLIRVLVWIYILNAPFFLNNVMNKSIACLLNSANSFNEWHFMNWIIWNIWRYTETALHEWWLTMVLCNKTKSDTIIFVHTSISMFTYQSANQAICIQICNILKHFEIQKLEIAFFNNVTGNVNR